MIDDSDISNNIKIFSMQHKPDQSVLISKNMNNYEMLCSSYEDNVEKFIRDNINNNTYIINHIKNGCDVYHDSVFACTLILNVISQNPFKCKCNFYSFCSISKKHIAFIKSYLLYHINFNSEVITFVYDNKLVIDIIDPLCLYVKFPCKYLNNGVRLVVDCFNLEPEYFYYSDMKLFSEINNRLSKKILIVDDSYVSLKVIRRLLISYLGKDWKNCRDFSNFDTFSLEESDEYTFVYAKNGKIASLLTEMFNFSLIITDIDMPIMNGIEFVQKLEFANIIMCSSENSYEDLVGHRFISKPIQKHEFYITLDLFIGTLVNC